MASVALNVSDAFPTSDSGNWNLALRQQVAVFKQSVKRPKLRPRDRAITPSVGGPGTIGSRPDKLGCPALTDGTAAIASLSPFV